MATCACRYLKCNTGTTHEHGTEHNYVLPLRPKVYLVSGMIKYLSGGYNAPVQHSSNDPRSQLNTTLVHRALPEATGHRAS
jgi:hypothetical protein